MFYIHTCNPKVDNSILATTQTEREAFKIASQILDKATDTYDTYVSVNSRIIGFGSTGRIPDCGDESDPCTRGGSVLFGREHE
jgi:hypothetical protein